MLQGGQDWSLHTVTGRTGLELAHCYRADRTGACTLLQGGQDWSLHTVVGRTGLELAHCYRADRADRTGACTLLQGGQDGTLVRYYTAHRMGHLHTVKQRTGRENFTLIHSGQGGTFALLTG